MFFSNLVNLFSIFTLCLISLIRDNFYRVSTYFSLESYDHVFDFFHNFRLCTLSIHIFMQVSSIAWCIASGSLFSRISCHAIDPKQVMISSQLILSPKNFSCLNDIELFKLFVVILFSLMRILHYAVTKLWSNKAEAVTFVLRMN